MIQNNCLVTNINNFVANNGRKEKFKQNIEESSKFYLCTLWRFCVTFLYHMNNIQCVPISHRTLRSMFVVTHVSYRYQVIVWAISIIQGASKKFTECMYLFLSSKTAWKCVHPHRQNCQDAPHSVEHTMWKQIWIIQHSNIRT